VNEKKWISLFIVTAVFILVSLGVSGQATANSALFPDVESVVDLSLWAQISEDPDHQAWFVIVLEAPGGNFNSAISNQMAFVDILEHMKRLGSIQDFQIFYGQNQIQVHGSSSALRYLASWPEVVAVNPVNNQFRSLDSASITASNTLSASGHLTGTVTGPDTITPLAGIDVTAWRYTGSIWVIENSDTTDLNGKYDIGSLPAASYKVRFNDPLGIYVREYYDNKKSLDAANFISVFDEGVVTDVNASLAQAGFIAGTITAQNGGSPVVDIVATAYYTETGSWHMGPSGVSAGNGTYTIKGLAPGTYRVRFSDVYNPPRYIDEYYNNKPDRSSGDDVTVTAGNTTTGINAAMGSYGSLSGTVYGPEGVIPLSGIQVDVYDPSWIWVGDATTDSNGDYKVGGLVTGDYWVEYTDPIGQMESEFYPDLVHVELGINTGSVDINLSLAEVNRQLSLAPDWNLVSSPVIPSDSETGTILANLGVDYVSIWAYDGCVSGGTWTSYARTAPPYANSLHNLDEEHGYWLQTTISKTLTLTGTLPLSTQINLCTGWNLISFPSPIEQKVTDALAGIAGKYNLVYGFDAWDTADPWELYSPGAPPQVNDLKKLRPGYGYWIRMTQPATLSIPGR